MAEIERKLNEPMKLNLGLSDGTASLPVVVKCKLTQFDGTFISQLTLTHIGDGAFYDETFLMPNFPTVRAKFFVYKSDGVTLDPFFSIADDIYKLIGANKSDLSDQHFEHGDIV